MKSEKRQNTRRKLLSVVGGMSITSLAGCTGMIDRARTDPESPEAKPDNPPSPEIVDALAEIQLFRQTEDEAKLIAVIENQGVEGEFEIEVKAMAGGAIYDMGTSVFSIESGDRTQIGFDLFTHSGAEKIEIFIKSTRWEDMFDRLVIEDGQEDYIDYTA